MKSYGTMSRVLSVLLCLAMLFGVMPITSLTASAEEATCAHTEEVTTELPASTDLAASKLENGGSYKLMGDVTLTGTVTLTGGVRLHLDLNGHTLSGKGDLFLLVGEDAPNEVLLTVCDSSIKKTGTISQA